MKNMDQNIKVYDLFVWLYNNNLELQTFISKHLQSRKIRHSAEEKWKKIESPNFISPIPEMKEFIDMFSLGYNIGNCENASRQLSYSYDNVDIVSGILPILKVALNAEREGGHVWLETYGTIIDTTLMLVIDKTLKQEL